MPSTYVLWKKAIILNHDINNYNKCLSFKRPSNLSFRRWWGHDHSPYGWVSGLPGADPSPMIQCWFAWSGSPFKDMSPSLQKLWSQQVKNIVQFLFKIIAFPHRNTFVILPWTDQFIGFKYCLIMAYIATPSFHKLSCHPSHLHKVFPHSKVFMTNLIESWVRAFMGGHAFPGCYGIWTSGIPKALMSTGGITGAYRAHSWNQTAGSNPHSTSAYLARQVHWPNPLDLSFLSCVMETVKSTSLIGALDELRPI